jgi:PAS domain S-box-containing protein
MNSAGGIEFWNRKALELFGYSFEEIDTAEKWFARAYPDPASRKAVLERWNALVSDSEPGHIQRDEYNITCKDGRVLTVEVTSTRCGDLTIVIFNDITQRKLAEEELRRHRDNLEELVSARTAELRIARDQAEVANKAKSTFLANMSHEIRTPMTAILGFAQLLRRDRSLSSEQHGQIETINHAGGHLLAIINDILEMSKIEAGRATVTLSPFNLHALLDHLVEICRVRAEAKGIELELDRAPEVPRQIISDEGKLRQTLLNLLGNAVKFTNEGSVRMRADVSTCEDGSLTLRLTITDTGPGISQEDIARIFQPFFQTSITITGEGGTGLGLAISKQYADILGGSIAVQSEPGRGSIFTLTIPVRAADEGTGIEPPPHPVIRRLAPNLPPVRILAVDDYAPNRELLRSMLEPLGFEVRLAADGREAVDAYNAWHPHAILMDMCMPVMDGYEANRLIRAASAGNDIFIVALTASAFEEGKADILASGAEIFVRKPFQQEALLDLLGERLGLQYEQIETESEVSSPDSPTELTKAIRGLSSAMRGEFLAACRTADYEKLMTLCDGVSKSDPNGASLIRRLANAFAYDKLSSVLSEK